MVVIPRSRTFARAVAVAAALTGITALFGWATGRPELTMLGSEITMKANAAACFLLLGAALWRRASPAGGRDALAAALSLGAAVIGGLTLLEHLSGIDFHVDQLLFTEPPGMPATASPGRMGPPASTSFLLLGVALASLRTRHPAARAAVHAMALATAFVALLPLVGYGYGSTQLYGVARYTGIALPTALTLEAIALAVLAVIPESGLVSALRGSGGAGQLARRTLVYSTAIPLTAGWAIALGLQRGLYDGTFAIAFLVLSLILSVTLLTWRDAVHIGRVEQQREAAMRESERSRQALREALVRLEESEAKARARTAELEDADRRKDEFLAVLAHELRNPLAPIRNSIFLLARLEPGTDRARAKLAVIERQIAHLTRLVDDLLDVSRISRGKVHLQRTALDLGALVRRAAEDHRDAVVAAGLDLAVEVPDEPLWVEADGTRLAQVTGNLLSNAVKFTHRGGRITVSLRRDGAHAVLGVRDTGIGIDEAMRARLFEPFAQAEQPLDRSRGGLGLGLTLVRGFVALHGGSVEARSDGPGTGAEFLVRLPLGGAPLPAAADASSAPAPVPLRVLVIEDNVDSAETLRDALADAGHEVSIARDGAEGVASARRWAPDVVLCDVGLPGLDGYAVARALRADGGRRVALIALTGYASPEDRRRAAAAGFDHHLAKPADLDELVGLLARVSARNREIVRGG
jgi:signal transduction histidine kinase/CheY-like chemotaxis protein